MKYISASLAFGTLVLFLPHNIYLLGAALTIAVLCYRTSNDKAFILQYGLYCMGGLMWLIMLPCILLING